MAGSPTFERQFTIAEKTLPTDAEAARVRYERAKAEFGTAGRPAISIDLERRNNQFLKDFITKWLDELDASLSTYGPDLSKQKLDEFVNTYMPDIIRLFRSDPQQRADIQNRITQLRDKFKKEQLFGAKPPELNPKDIEDLNNLQAQTEVYEKELQETRTKGLHFDPRVDFGGTGIPVSVLAELRKKAENWIPDKGSSIEELQKRQKILEIITQTDNLVKEWQTEITAIDSDILSTWEPLTPADRTSLSTYSASSDSHLDALSEAILMTEVNELGQIKSRIEATKNALASRYSNDLLKLMGDLFRGFNIDHLLNSQHQKINELLTQIDEQNARRQSRIDVFQEGAKKSSEIDNHRARIREMIAQVEGSKAKVMTWETDVLVVDSKPLYDYLERVRDSLSIEQFRDLEQEVLFFDYRNSKRVLDATITRHEIAEADYKDFYGTERPKLIDNRIYTRFDRIINQLSSTTYPGVNAAFLKEIEDDADGFIKESKLRMEVFATEMSVDSQIWWNGAPDEKASRGIPSGASAYWDVNQESIDTVIKSVRPVSSDPRLRFPEEYQHNHNLGNEKKDMVDHSDPTKLATVDLAKTLNGEIMRILDEIYSNAASKKYTTGGKPKYPDIDNFFRTMHLKYNSGGPLLKHVLTLAKNEHGIDPKTLGMTDEQFTDQVKRVWYMHALFLNHSMLLSSSASLSDTAYYANRFLEYALKEANEGVISYDLRTLLLIVGKYDDGYFSPTPTNGKNPEGKRYIFDFIGRVDKSKLPKPKGLIGRLAAAATPINDRGATSLREKMMQSLHHEMGNEGKKFEFLANLPWVTLDKSPFGGYHFLPLPLQYMIFEDKSAAYALKRNEEKPVKRWGSTTPGFEAAPITAADYVTPRGEILYEEIPWKDVLSSTSLLDWYNNGSNELNLLALVRSKTKTELPSREDIALMKKDAKYGATVLPKWGLEASAGRVDSSKVFDRFIVIYILGKCIYLLENGQTLTKVEELINNLVPSISPESAEAIKVVLKSGFGTIEALEEYGQMLQEQIKTAAKYQQ